MPKKAIVHIGLDKTGTTTIQKLLFKQRSALLQRGILYPSWGWNHSMFLAALFFEERAFHLPKMPDGSSIDDAKEQYWPVINADLQQDFDTLLISGEVLSMITADELATFGTWLERYVSTVSVIAYVRDPIDWTRSRVQQRVKQGETLGQIYDDLRGPEWQERLSPWVKRFGVDALSAVAFEEALKHGLLNSFCAAAGIPNLSEGDDAQENPSLSRESVDVIDCLNRHYFPSANLSVKRRMDIVLKLAGAPGERFELPETAIQEIQEIAQPDVKWLNQTLGLDLYPALASKQPWWRRLVEKSI